MITPLESRCDEDLLMLLETSILGSMHATPAVLPHMRTRRGDRIINVPSMCGRMTLPLYSAYCGMRRAASSS